MARSLALASFYSSCAAAQVKTLPEVLRGEPLSIAQFLTLGECPAIYIACPGGDYVTVRVSKGVDSPFGRLRRGEGCRGEDARQGVARRVRRTPQTPPYSTQKSSCTRVYMGFVLV